MSESRLLLKTEFGLTSVTYGMFRIAYTQSVVSEFWGIFAPPHDSWMTHKSLFDWNQLLV